MSEQLAEEVLHRAALAIETGAPPYDAVAARVRARRSRRRRLRLGVAAGVVAALAVVTAVAAQRGPAAPDRLPPAPVHRVPNPVGVAWYAGGALHLPQVVVDLPDLLSVVELDGGAVYADAAGQVAYVGADGARRALGRLDPRAGLLGSRGARWAAWVDPGHPDEASGQGPRLRVYDVGRGELLASRDVAGEGVRLIAIDQARVYYDTGGTTASWEPVTGIAGPVDRGGLADVESATRVYQQGGRLDMVQPFYNVHFVRRGTGADLSPGGSYLVTRPPRTPPGPFRPLVYDVRSGTALPSGLRRGETAVDAAFDGSGAVVLLVSRGDGRALVLRRCELPEHACADLGVAPSGDGPALLAH